ncbi:hypothetical protein ACG5V6_18575 [Streptomyces chitinivorans]|uniref:Uncharacterized protein n=1 Tax=Streptomyces chitinivorans TaxID=1257027 RepID=A0ABW7HWD3_9ACTN|nr:hypothetical protein [Streptomyces chitinivorans]MDH2412468.1 hypothetical protein [Streptomyces chitinivorans]
MPGAKSATSSSGVRGAAAPAGRPRARSSRATATPQGSRVPARQERERRALGAWRLLGVQVGPVRPFEAGTAG